MIVKTHRILESKTWYMSQLISAADADVKVGIVSKSNPSIECATFAKTKKDPRKHAA